MEAAKAAFRALGPADRAAFAAFVAAESAPSCCPVADVTVVLSGETGKKAKFNGHEATVVPGSGAWAHVSISSSGTPNLKLSEAVTVPWRRGRWTAIAPTATMTSLPPLGADLVVQILQLCVLASRVEARLVCKYWLECSRRRDVWSELRLPLVARAFSYELLYSLTSWAAPGSAGGLHLLDLGFEAGRPARCEAEVDLTSAETRWRGSLDLVTLVYRSAATLHTLYLRDDYPWLKARDLRALKRLSALAHLQIRLPSDFQREHLPDVCQPGLVSLHIQDSRRGDSIMDDGQGLGGGHMPSAPFNACLRLQTLGITVSGYCKSGNFFDAPPAVPTLRLRIGGNAGIPGSEDLPISLHFPSVEHLMFKIAKMWGRITFSPRDNLRTCHLDLGSCSLDEDTLEAMYTTLAACSQLAYVSLDGTGEAFGLKRLGEHEWEPTLGALTALPNMWHCQVPHGLARPVWAQATRADFLKDLASEGWTISSTTAGPGSNDNGMNVAVARTTTLIKVKHGLCEYSSAQLQGGVSMISPRFSGDAHPGD